ncbi:unnamed protein product [Caenorhabditis auriculariae]|uniref:Uncharacterized protein n=1 Tax=Caenorhabditis auriculariae TaxID=2777116 RepID=A0A8S1HJH0_9PELO|nr:unnamed protein product [Caenorhabditis auriculariae]
MLEGRVTYSADTHDEREVGQTTRQKRSRLLSFFRQERHVWRIDHGLLPLPAAILSVAGRSFVVQHA